MAKKKLTDLVEKAPKSKPGRKLGELGRSVSVGVGLKEGEVQEIDDLAAGLGVARNAVLAWIIRHSLREIREGRLTIPVEVETKRKLGSP